MYKYCRALLVLTFLMFIGDALAQVGPFKPGDNPVSNQAWNAVTVTFSNTAFIAPTRALYNGNASACNIVFVPNGNSGAAVTLQNVQPGEIIPVQAIQVQTGTSCAAGTVIAFY